MWRASGRVRRCLERGQRRDARGRRAWRGEWAAPDLGADVVVSLLGELKGAGELVRQGEAEGQPQLGARRQRHRLGVALGAGHGGEELLAVLLPGAVLALGVAPGGLLVAHRLRRARCVLAARGDDRRVCADGGKQADWQAPSRQRLELQLLLTLSRTLSMVSSCATLSSATPVTVSPGRSVAGNKHTERCTRFAHALSKAQHRPGRRLGAALGRGRAPTWTRAGLQPLTVRAVDTHEQLQRCRAHPFACRRHGMCGGWQDARNDAVSAESLCRERERVYVC